MYERLSIQINTCPNTCPTYTCPTYTCPTDTCPYTCPYYGGTLPEYSTDMCPKTLDYLSRAVRVAIEPSWTPQECEAVAAGVNKVAEALLT